MLYLHNLFQLLFPSYCAGCAQPLVHGESAICIACQYSLPKLHHLDYRDNKLEQKFWGRAEVQTATAFLKMTKKSRVRKMIHELKYHNNKSIGISLGRLFGRDLLLSKDMHQFDYILPVPLHPKKLFQRGYNQCDCIAEGLSHSMHIPICHHNLVRIRYNKSQTKKTRYKRWENVDGIFAVNHPDELQGKSILLIDDIITTGSTIEACAHELNKIKGLSLSVGALAMSES